MVDSFGVGRRDARTRWKLRNPGKTEELMRNNNERRKKRRKTDPAYLEKERRRWVEYNKKRNLNTCRLLLSKLENPPHDPETLFNEESLTKILGPVKET